MGKYWLMYQWNFCSSSGNVFDQAGEMIQNNDYPLAGLIHLGNTKYHSSDTDWDDVDGNTMDMEFASNQRLV